MQESPKEPFYLIPSDHPLLEEYKPSIDRYMSGILSEGTTMHLVVPPDVVEAGVVSTVQEMFQVLQHYPELLEGLIFNISIKFQIPGTDEYYEDYDWLDATHIAWLYKLMNTCSIIVLFVQDPMQQLLGLMGDLILQDQSIMERITAQENTEYKLTAEQMSILDQRLFEACRYILVYLYGSGIDPKKYILEMLDAYKIKFPYHVLLEVHQDDIKNGRTFSFISISDN